MYGSECHLLIVSSLKGFINFYDYWSNKSNVQSSQIEDKSWSVGHLCGLVPPHAFQTFSIDIPPYYFDETATTREILFNRIRLVIPWERYGQLHRVKIRTHLLHAQPVDVVATVLCTRLSPICCCPTFPNKSSGLWTLLTHLNKFSWENTSRPTVTPQWNHREDSARCHRGSNNNYGSMARLILSNKSFNASFASYFQNLYEVNDKSEVFTKRLSINL